jgi:AraC family transcriptional regulator, arabinose operon regulatory protein
MRDPNGKTEPNTGKKNHFYGDRSFVLSKRQLEMVQNNPLVCDLYITDIGFYPHAKNHYRKRIKGTAECILIYCIDGEGFIKTMDTVFHLIPDSYFIIPAHTAHSYWASESAPWSIYWIHFTGKKSELFRDFCFKVIPILRSPHARIDDRINQFNEILTALEMGFTRNNIEFANLSLHRILASFFYVETFRSVKGIKSNDPVEQSIFFMLRNLNYHLKIEDLAKHVNLSESHLSRLFKNKTGSSPIDYFISLRMQEAIRLLTNKSLRIKEVAFLLGYNDPYYFTRIFTKQIGTSPASFVKTTRKKRP